MSREKYEELIDELCDRLGVEDPASLYDLCSLRLNDIDFTLTHGDFIDDDTLMVYCDLGEIPDDRKELIIERLMEVNLQMFGKDDYTYAANPENGHALILLQIPLSLIECDPLIIKLTELTAFTYSWRNGYFMTDQELIDWRKEKQKGVTT